MPGGVGSAGHLFAVPRLFVFLGSREDVHQAVVEHRRTDRLQQVIVDADLRRLGANVLSPEGGDNGNLGNMLQATTALDYLARLQAVHAGHLPVHQHQSIGIGRVGRDQFPDRVFARGNRFGPQGEETQIFGENLARLLVVVDDQCAQPGDVRDKALLRCRCASDPKPDVEDEAAAFSVFALGPDGAVHHLHQLLGDRKPKSGSAVLARGRSIGLGKRLKEPRTLLRGHADSAVAHRESNFDPIVDLLFKSDADHDLTLVREFDGVIYQVDQYLAKP